MDALDRCRQLVFKDLWRHYYSLVPDAPHIEKALQQRGDLWVEDHVAYRTLAGPHCGSAILQGIFEAIGYQRQDDYHFDSKQLNAFWLAPPDINGRVSEASPKIFISELIPDRFSPRFKEVLSSYTSQVKSSPLSEVQRLSAAAKVGDLAAADSLVALISAYLSEPAPWSRPSYEDFKVLQEESEYASWTLLFGNQINHFTVSVHLMKSFSNIQDLARYLAEELKIPMNTAGGMVKGTPELLLEQIATKAVKRPCLFQEGMKVESYGFVEFALRYPKEGHKADENWQSYYQGFVTSNADKIFESTYR